MKPVGYKRVNKATGREVSKDDIVKGVEVSDGQYVVLGDDEIRSGAPQTTQTVEILGFVEGGPIAPGFFERPYVLHRWPAARRCTCCCARPFARAAASASRAS